MFETIRFAKTFEALHVNASSGTYLLLVAEKTPFSLEVLPSHLRFFGAIFPRVIFGTQSFDEGIVIAKLSEQSTPTLITHMLDWESLSIDAQSRTVFGIVDGFSSLIECFLENIYTRLPEATKMIGAGAGKLSLAQEPIIFDNYGIYANSALIIQSPSPISLGIKHGWEPLVAPLIATQCQEHLLEKINFQDAYTFYKEAVESDTPMRFTTDNFFDIAKSYPIGIVRYNKDFIVRDLIGTDEKALRLIGDMDSNSVIAILKGEPEKLVLAAQEASSISYEHAPFEPSSTLLIDCISRFLFLETFTKELEAVASSRAKEIPLWGVLSMGEIANANEEGIEFYNKTCVVGTL